MITKLIRRVLNRLKRILRIFGVFCQVRQIDYWPAAGSKIGRLLIIGPGAVAVPPRGWGAVETIIAETIPTYTEVGFDVMLINSKAIQDWSKGLAFKPDVVLVHDDISTRRAALLYRGASIISITHYGLAEFPERWHPSYRQVLRSLNHADTVVALNQRIKHVLENHLHKPKIIVSSNGTSFQPTLVGEQTEKFICVGKVERRKRQFELFKSLENSDLQVDFIGEIVDERVNKLLNISSTARTCFKGSYDRKKLQHELSRYKALILLSDGEGDALVLYEAQAAGLPIIISQESIGDQDASLPWVRVVDQNTGANQILDELKKIAAPRELIAEFAQLHYGWSNRNSRLVQEMIRELEIK